MQGKRWLGKIMLLEVWYGIWKIRKSMFFLPCGNFSPPSTGPSACPLASATAAPPVGAMPSASHSRMGLGVFLCFHVLLLLCIHVYPAIACHAAGFPGDGQFPGLENLSVCLHVLQSAWFTAATQALLERVSVWGKCHSMSIKVSGSRAIDLEVARKRSMGVFKVSVGGVGGKMMLTTGMNTGLVFSALCSSYYFPHLLSLNWEFRIKLLMICLYLKYHCQHVNTLEGSYFIY